MRNALPLPHPTSSVPVGSQLVTVWEGLRGAALLEEGCHWGLALRLSGVLLLPVCSLCFTLSVEVMSFLLSGLVALFPCHDGLLCLWNHKPE